MASTKYTFQIDSDFSLDDLADGIVKRIEEEGLTASIERIDYNTCIIRSTNVCDRGSHIARTITGTVRSISVFLSVNDNILTMYFDQRAWVDKATGYAFSWICFPLFFSASYGGIRQLYLEDKIVRYVRKAINTTDKEILNMNMKQRILLATPIVSLIIFLTMGFVFNMWGWGCLAFLLIPLMPIVLGEVSLDALFPIIITVAYFGLGFGLGLWHPAWIMFLTIPVYYILFPQSVRKTFRRKYTY